MQRAAVTMLIFVTVLGTPGLVDAQGNAPAFGASVVVNNDGANFVAAGDFNGDGKPDIVTMDELAPSVRVSLNTTEPGGAPSFQTPASFAVGPAPRRLAVGDVTGDGKPDIVVTLGESDKVAILTNNTQPGAAEARFEGGRNATFPTGNGPRELSLSDFNGDGKLDIAVANASDGTVTMLVNTIAPRATAPSFVSAQTIRVASGLNSLAVADFDGDGRPDLAAANGSAGTVSILRNAPGGARGAQLQNPITTSVGGWAGPLVAADLDRDGAADLTVADKDGGALILLRNQTAAGSGKPDLAVAGSVPVVKRPQVLAVADLNADGAPDLVTGGADGRTVSPTINTTAAGGELAFGAGPDLSVGAVPRGLLLVDLNADDRPDVLVGGGDARARVVSNTSSTSDGGAVAGAAPALPRSTPAGGAVAPPGDVPATEGAGADIVAATEPSAVGECGPPSTTIPGPPPEIIRVGWRMPESWLRCYVWQDLVGQDYIPEQFESVEHVFFRGYPVECWNALGSTTEGLILRLLAWGDQGRQHVRFTYRIQMDGDYINNCAQEIVP